MRALVQEFNTSHICNFVVLFCVDISKHFGGTQIFSLGPCNLICVFPHEWGNNTSFCYLISLSGLFFQTLYMSKYRSEMFRESRSICSVVTKLEGTIKMMWFDTWFCRTGNWGPGCDSSPHRFSLTHTSSVSLCPFYC